MAKQAKKQGPHEEYLGKPEAHIPAGTSDGGACLTAHHYYYEERNSCSYRWQGLLQGKAEGRSAYNAHYKSEYHIGKQSIAAMPAAIAPKNRDRIGKFNRQTKKNTIPYVELMLPNFATSRKPYSNQVHHVLNKASLYQAVDDLEKKYAGIRAMISDGLLAEKYNINHKINMLILPTQAKACGETGLPNHCSGGHPNYNKKLLAATKTAVEKYQGIAKQLKNRIPHDDPERKQLKEDLAAISKTMYTNILALAAANRAKKAAEVSLNDIHHSAFAGI